MTRLPSLELTCDAGRNTGACDSGYACDTSGLHLCDEQLSCCNPPGDVLKQVLIIAELQSGPRIRENPQTESMFDILGRDATADESDGGRVAEANRAGAGVMGAAAE